MTQQANRELTVEEIAEQVKQAVQPVMTRIESLEKSQQPKSVWDNLFVTEGYRLK